MSSKSKDMKELTFILNRNAPEFASRLLAYAVALEKITAKKQQEEGGKNG